MPTNQPDELTTGSMKPEKHSIAGNLIKYGIPLVITLGLCWLLFHNINFSEMMEIIRRDCNFWWIGLALVISIFSPRVPRHALAHTAACPQHQRISLGHHAQYLRHICRQSRIPAPG